MSGRCSGTRRVRYIYLTRRVPEQVDVAVAAEAGEARRSERSTQLKEIVFDQIAKAFIGFNHGSVKEFKHAWSSKLHAPSGWSGATVSTCHRGLPVARGHAGTARLEVVTPATP